MGMGKRFRGVFHQLDERMYCFAPGTERRVDLEVIHGLMNPLLDERFPDEAVELREAVALAREALPSFWGRCSLRSWPNGSKANTR
jgi:peptide chain release factor 3